MKGRKVCGLALGLALAALFSAPAQGCPTRAAEPLRSARRRRCGSSGASTGATRASASGSAPRERLWRGQWLWQCAAHRVSPHDVARPSAL
jgi:hypothetical protein